MLNNRNGFMLHWVGLFLIWLFLPVNAVKAQDSGLPVLVHFESGATPPPSYLPLNIKQIKVQDWQVETAPEHWRSIRLPFYTEYPRPKIHLKGRFLYKNSAHDSRLILYSGGIHGFAEIKINGSLIAQQNFNYLPFEIAINKDALTEGVNEIEIHLRAPEKLEEGFPVLPKIYAEQRVFGLLRPLFFYPQSTASLSGLKVRLQNFAGSKAEIAYRYRFDLPAEVKAKAKLIKAEEWFLNENNKVVFHSIKFIPAGRNFRENTFSLDTSYVWSVQRPVRLKLKIVLSTDRSALLSQTYRIAARTVQYRNNALHLNGQRLTIRGVNYHQNIGSYRNKGYYDMVKADFSALKEAGFNAVRFPHYLPDPSSVGIADSLGLLLFCEIPVWQYPAALLSEPAVQKQMKNILLNFERYYGLSPAVTAFSLGQELPLHKSRILRRFIVLHSLAKENISVPTYLSPIPDRELPLREASDFYIYDAYHPILTESKFFLQHKLFNLIGKLGVLYSPAFLNAAEEANSDMRMRMLRSEVGLLNEIPNLQGGFIQSFNDWKPVRSSLITKITDSGAIMPDGLFTYGHRAKYRINELRDIWKTKDSIITKEKRMRSNFFSIAVFFASIVFFLMYRRRRRLSDNIKRSLRHPYGFYIDLRERRTIPVYDSFILGIFISFILAITVSSIVYYYHFTGTFQEICAVLFVNSRIYETVLSVCNTPYQLVIVFFIPILIFPFALSLILKTVSLFTHTSIRIRQFLAISYWSGSPLLFMIPLALIAYHWLVYLDMKIYLLVFVAVFIIWINWRLIYSIRIFFHGKSFTILLVLLLSYTVPFLILGAVFKPFPYWFNYLIFLAEMHSLY
ncbi:MAG TPA: hypothetical protein ENK44_06355 [Caldithrix abyssi]|uniref:Glycoside hydrolase family 2 catalytic domain-containing protein n=1 Tax=Caldithrix abyssi TaxID=187145 RepID=A0A7V4TZL3_CALAY|nr:hypothetical protein [Caldithrix abyssi]